MSNDGGPAFPTGTTYDGMSMRDWFAGQALTGAVAIALEKADVTASDAANFVARLAYKLADEMLEVRAGEQAEGGPG